MKARSVARHNLSLKPIEVRLAAAWDATTYAAVHIGFEVREVLDAAGLTSRPDRRVMSVRQVTPYYKDYDAYPDNGPNAWSRRFDVSTWQSWDAFIGDSRVGGAVLAPRGDVGVLWDIRVAPDARRGGVGAALLAAIEEWGPRHGIHRLEVETQNVNVPAYTFYTRNGFTLTEVKAHAYPSLPDEVQLILHKQLPGADRR